MEQHPKIMYTIQYFSKQQQIKYLAAYTVLIIYAGHKILFYFKYSLFNYIQNNYKNNTLEMILFRKHILTHAFYEP